MSRASHGNGESGAGAGDRNRVAATSREGRATQAREAHKVTPAGLVVRRLRHERGWPPRTLIAAIGEASFRASGLRHTITPNLLAGIEERNERVPYDTLCLVAGGLDCDPIDILG